MQKHYQRFLKKARLTRLAAIFATSITLVSLGAYSFAAPTSEFTQAINAGSLSIDIVDGAYAAVTTPSFNMTAAPFSFTCQPSTGVFGTASQQIYIKNPDASDTGWTLSIAASAPEAKWDSTTSAIDFDFNDSNTAGCGDGADTDTLKGQMTINPSVATLATGTCATCNVTGITKGASTAFVETTGNNITLLSAAAGSSDIGDWTLRGIDVSQQIPAEQPAANDYKISLTVSIVGI